jgi:hypothetical protein
MPRAELRNGRHGWSTLPGSVTRAWLRTRLPSASGTLRRHHIESSGAQARARCQGQPCPAGTRTRSAPLPSRGDAELSVRERTVAAGVLPDTPTRPGPWISSRSASGRFGDHQRGRGGLVRGRRPRMVARTAFHTTVHTRANTDGTALTWARCGARSSSWESAGSPRHTAGRPCAGESISLTERSVRTAYTDSVSMTPPSSSTT